MVSVHVPTSSKRSQDLEQELRATIAGFQSRDPRTSADDVRMALAAVTPVTPVTPARRVATLASVVGGVAVAGLLSLFMGARENGRPLPWIVLTVGIAVALAAIGAAWARVRNDD